MDGQPYAWAVEYGRGLVALFLDRARAEHAAVSLHGVIVALVRQIERQDGGPHNAA